jgi:mycothiol synthase
MSITIRPYGRGADEPLRVDIYNRVHATDEDHVPSTLEETLRWDQHPGAAHARRFIAELDGVPAGFALADVDPDQAEPKGYLGGPHVLPELRRKGIGTALVNRVIEDLRERGMKQAESEERDRPETNCFLAALGFRVVRVFSFMRRRLDSLPGIPALPPGLRAGREEPTTDVLAAVVAVSNEAFREHYNYSPAALPNLEFFFRACAEEGTPAHIVLARAGNEPVGYLTYGYEPRANAAIGKKRAWLWDLGVLKPFRGRGIASALMTSAMQDLGNDGIEETELRVDDTNVTGARRLYEKLGFGLAYRTLAHLKDL